MSTFHLTVFPNRYVSAWSGCQDPDEFENGYSLPLKKALQTRYPFDAHAVQWVIPNWDKPPRLEKSSLKEIKKDGDVWFPELRSVFIDIDAPEHAEVPWDQDESEWDGDLRRWISQIRQAQSEFSPLEDAIVYKTRGGLRFCWELPTSRWVQAPRANSYLSQFYDELESAGLPCDRLDEWTRMFRLPAVERDGVETEPRLDLSGSGVLDWKAPEALSESISGTGEADRQNMPDPGNVESPSKSDFKSFEDKDYWSILYHGDPVADPGERHNRLVEIVSSIVAKKETTDPIVPFRFVADSVRSMDDFPHSEAWDICVWACRHQDAQNQSRQREDRTFREKQADAMGCDPAEVGQRLILYTTKGGTYFIWNEREREYLVKCSETQQLRPLLVEQCPQLSGIEQTDIRSAATMLKRYGTSVSRLVYSYIRDRVELDRESRTLYVPVLTVDSDLEPQEHNEIQEFLERLFDDRHEEGLDWLSTLLEFDRQTCALYIDGPPDIGKSLLAHGIARIWNTAPTEYYELLDDFQSALLECPLVYADENVPQDPFGEQGSALFRRVTGRSRQKISEKFVDKSDLEGALRVLICANDSKALNFEEQLGPDDIKALQQRIGYIRTTDAAGEYLDELKRERGLESRRDVTEEWIAGGKMAEHILWLNENREVSRGDRFLVEGWESDLTSNLVFQLEDAQRTLRFIVAALRDGRAVRALRFDEEGIWVNTGHLQSEYERVIGGDVTEPGFDEAVDVIRTLSGGRAKPLEIQEEQGVSRRLFWCIDPQDVIRAAEFYKTAVGEEIKKAIRNRVEESRDEVPEENVQALDELSG